jgi:hypothetical protein
MIEKNSAKKASIKQATI